LEDEEVEFNLKEFDRQQKKEAFKNKRIFDLESATLKVMKE